MAHRSSRGALLGAFALVAFALGATARNARAGDGASPDRIVPADDPLRHAIDRTWLYADDARVASPMVVVAETDASYTDVGASPTRIVSPYPNVYKSFAANTAQPGGMLGIGAEVGLLPRISIVAMGQMGFGGLGSSPDAGAIAGLRVQLLPLSWRNVRLVASGGYVREAWQGPIYHEETHTWLPGSPHGDNGAWLQVAAAGDVQRWRMAGTIHAEHVFADGRDGVDVMVEAGASYRIVDGLRGGIEYVGQDLEELANPGAEAGARHFIGPTASLQLMSDRLTIAAGPAFGLSDPSPRVLGRLVVAYAF